MENDYCLQMFLSCWDAPLVVFWIETAGVHGDFLLDLFGIFELLASVANLKWVKQKENPGNFPSMVLVGH